MDKIDFWRRALPHRQKSIKSKAFCNSQPDPEHLASVDNCQLYEFSKINWVIAPQINGANLRKQPLSLFGFLARAVRAAGQPRRQKTSKNQSQGAGGRGDFNAVTLEKRVFLCPFIFLNFISPGSVQNPRVHHLADQYKTHFILKKTKQKFVFSECDR